MKYRIKFSRNGRESGYAVMTALLFFLGSTAAVVASLSDGALREVRIVRNESHSKQSYYLSESSAEDVAYRIRNSLSFNATESLTIGGATASTSVTTLPDGSTSIRADANAQGTIRTLELNLHTDDTVSFPYALQAGVGGIDMSGSSSIDGDIYTTGSIRGCSSCSVTGMAVAAGVSTSNLDVNTSGSIPPSSSITFGNANGTQDLAQSFSVSQSLSLVSLDIYLRKIGSPANATVRVTTDNAGRPSSTVLASGTLSSSLVSTSYEWESITLTSNPVLTAGNIYWIVVDANTNSSSYYVVGAENVYVSGEGRVGRYGNNSWSATSPAGLDAYMRIYIGSNEDGVSGESEWNRLDVGSAYAREVSFVDAVGTIYCQIGTSNNKPCDTSRADPIIESNPISDADVAIWRDAASVSTHTGNYTLGGSSTATLGPKKVTGNMTIGDSAVLSISGSIWVLGNLTIDGSAKLQPANSTENYVIVVDGIVSLGGSADILGSASSHIVIVSMSTADPAVTISGSADDTVVSAPYGGLLVEGSGTVNVAAAKHITLTGSAQIEYDPSALDLDLTGGGGGGEVRIHSWKEVE